MRLYRRLGLVLLFSIFFSLLLPGFLGIGIGKVKASSNSYVPIKWALVEIDTANNGLDNYTGTRFTQDLANIIRSFGFPFDVFRHQDLTSTTLQFANGRIKYQAMILERPDSLAISEPTIDQKNWIKWAIGNGTNALFIKRSIQYFTDIFGGAITSVSAGAITFNFTQNYAGYALGTAGNVTPTENIFLTLSSFAGDATEIIKGNYTTTFGAFLLNRTYSQGEAWFLAERPRDHNKLGVMPNDATRTALFHVMLHELTEVPVYILPWQRFGSAHAFRIESSPSPVMINLTVMPGNFRKFFDVLVDETNLLKDYGYPATLFAITWGGLPPGSVQKEVSLTSKEPAGYSNIPSVPGYRVFGSLSRNGNTTGYKVVLYNGTTGGNYNTFKVDTDGDKDWGDETALIPGQNFTWYCAFDNYETTAFLAYNEAGWATPPSNIDFWTYIPITHQHSEKAATWAQIKSFIADLVDNHGWSIGLHGTDHAYRWWDIEPYQWKFANGTNWPVEYVETQIQRALNFLQQEFGTRVKKIMTYPHDPYATKEARQALVNLGFISEGYTDYPPSWVFPAYIGAGTPLRIPGVPVGRVDHPTQAWKYRGLSVSGLSAHRLGRSGLFSKVKWLNTTFQTNRAPYDFVYNKTSIWVTSPYEASLFYYHSMQMLRNIPAAYWTGNRIIIEFPASPNLKNFVWHFPLKHNGKYFNALIDNRTVGKIVKIDSESVFAEFSQGKGRHKIEVIYGVTPLPQKHTLTIATTEGGTTSPIPATYNYKTGTVINVTAYPSTDYVFDYWLLDGVNVGDPNPISITMDKDHALKAVFRYLPPPYLFDPNKYYTIREAEGAGAGYWMGAPGAFFDEETGVFWLVYRSRVPSERGYRLAIANSTDGIHFTDVWSASKYEFPAPRWSIVRCSILKDPKTGMFKLYISKGEPWAIYKLEDVSDPADFNPATTYLVLNRGASDEWDGDGIHYPWIRWIDDSYVMLYASGQMGLATSSDGESWTKHPDNPILDVGPGAWDKRRISTGSIMFLPEYWAVYYSGYPSVGYVERSFKTGLATWHPSPPPYRKLEKVTINAPLIQGIDPKYKSLWNLDYITAQGKTFFYYDTGTSDGSMELRVSVVERASTYTSFSQSSANLGDILSVRTTLYLTPPYTSATISEKLPGELSYWGGFTDSLVPNATPTIHKNTIRYTTNKTGKHVITFKVKVTKAYDHDQTLTNTVNATYQAAYHPYYYPDAQLTASTDLTIKSFKASFNNSKTAGPDSITANTSATWEITVTINNPYNYTMNAIVKENFGAHLKVSILSYSSGTPTLYTNKRGNQYRLLWSVSVNPEDTATLVLQITTTGIEKDKELSRGATIKFLDAENTKLSAKTSPITVTVLP